MLVPIRNKKDAEQMNNFLARKIAEESRYDKYFSDGRVWVTSGVGVISRLWLDCSTDILLSILFYFIFMYFIYIFLINSI